MCFVVFHMYHYIIQVSSKPIPAFKVVIRQLRTQQTSVTYLASVLANHRLLHYDIKTKMSNSGSTDTVRMAALLSHHCYATGATIGNTWWKSCEDGASHALQRVLRALRRHGFPSPWTSKCVHLTLGHSLHIC